MPGRLRLFGLLGLLGLVALAVANASCAASVGERRDPVIYGTDDRVALTSEEHPLLASALAALVPSERLVVDAERITWQATTLAERLGGRLCEGERFAAEPSLSDCSAVLVEGDAVLTAAHCVPNDAACDDLRVIFDYRRSGDLLPPTSEVFRCVAREDERPALDRVRLRLDRDTGRVPLSLGRATAGDRVSVAGHPAGVPALVETLEVDRREGDGLVLYADVEDGSSGSPVVRGDTLVGIVVAGETDYDWTGDCFASRRLSNGEGEGAWAADVVDAAGCQAAPTRPLFTMPLALVLLTIARGRRRSRWRGASVGCARRS